MQLQVFTVGLNTEPINIEISPISVHAVLWTTIFSKYTQWLKFSPYKLTIEVVHQMVFEDFNTLKSLVIVIRHNLCLKKVLKICNPSFS